MSLNLEGSVSLKEIYFVMFDFQNNMMSNKNE